VSTVRVEPPEVRLLAYVNLVDYPPRLVCCMGESVRTKPKGKASFLMSG
jgi:hypothetical protein